MSQADLANGIGMARTSITNVEAARQALVTPSFVNIAFVLGVEMRDLLPSWEEAGAVPSASDALELRGIERRLKFAEGQIHALKARRKELLGDTGKDQCPHTGEEGVAETPGV